MPLFGNFSARRERQDIRICPDCGEWCDIENDVDHAHLVCPGCELVREVDYDDLQTVGDLADELEMLKGG